MYSVLYFLSILLFVSNGQYLNEQFDLYSCKKGDVKRKDCNFCLCTDESWSCTKKVCPPTDFGKSDLALIDCNEGETKKIDCNSCHCSGGRWSCTRMGCIKPPPTHSKACISGEIKKVNCNSCWCSKGSWNCTMYPCINMVDCRDGEVKNENGKTCWCVQGFWTCNRIILKVAKETNTHRIAKRYTKCQKGETRIKPMQHCFCGNLGGGGHWICIDQEGTDDNEEERLCKPGDAKVEDCEDCFCAKQGEKVSWVCAKLPECDPIGVGVRSQRSRQAELSEPLPGCTEGDQMKIRCNNCSCRRGTWKCTKMHCGGEHE